MSLQSLYRRTPGTDRSGRSFPTATRVQVWQKASLAFGRDPALYRRDHCGALIYWYDCGNTASARGWEVDHIKPVEAGGSDDLSNLQALQWRNNRGKGDNWPQWFCTIRN